MTKADLKTLKDGQKIWVYVPKYETPDGKTRKAIVSFEVMNGLPIAQEFHIRAGMGFVGSADVDITWDEIPDTALVWTKSFGKALNYMRDGDKNLIE